MNMMSSPNDPPYGVMPSDQAAFEAEFLAGKHELDVQRLQGLARIYANIDECNAQTIDGWQQVVIRRWLDKEKVRRSMRDEHYCPDTLSAAHNAHAFAVEQLRKAIFARTESSALLKGVLNLLNGEQ